MDGDLLKTRLVDHYQSNNKGSGGSTLGDTLKRTTNLFGLVLLYCSGLGEHDVLDLNYSISPFGGCGTSWVITR